VPIHAISRADRISPSVLPLFCSEPASGRSPSWNRRAAVELQLDCSLLRALFSQSSCNFQGSEPWMQSLVPSHRGTYSISGPIPRQAREMSIARVLQSLDRWCSITRRSESIGRLRPRGDFATTRFSDLKGSMTQFLVRMSGEIRRGASRGNPVEEYEQESPECANSSEHNVGE